VSIYLHLIISPRIEVSVAFEVESVPFVSLLLLVVVVQFVVGFFRLDIFPYAAEIERE
jgi:hypothetical protein